MVGTQLRVLRPGEIEALLDLLDGWPFPDGQRGRDFFGRYIELDPSFEPRNVWVAERGGELVSCVQIFPRRVRIGGRILPMGGVGSVFTRPDCRRCGLAGALLERMIDAMRERGMVLSYLLAERLKWYERYGYRPWSRGVRILHWSAGTHRESSSAGSALEAGSRRVRRYEPERDRVSVERLWRRYAEGAGGAPLDGVVHRDAEDWRGSFQLAGNPDEDIWIAEEAGAVAAYLRVTDFGGLLRVLEWGREGDAAPALLDLLAAAPANRGAQSLRLPLVRDRDLEEQLTGAGARVEQRPAWDEVRADARPPATWMVQCLDPEALADQLGVPDGDGLLAGCLPAERFAFWEADRF